MAPREGCGLNTKASVYYAADPAASRSSAICWRKVTIWFQLGMLGDAIPYRYAARRNSPPTASAFPNPVGDANRLYLGIPTSNPASFTLAIHEGLGWLWMRMGSSSKCCSTVRACETCAPRSTARQSAVRNSSAALRTSRSGSAAGRAGSFCSSASRLSRDDNAASIVVISPPGACRRRTVRQVGDGAQAAGGARTNPPS